MIAALALACGVAAAAPAAGQLTFGQPVPLSRRPVLLPAMGFEVDFRYGLVGDGPTRFVNDIRFAPLPWLELRTALNPIPDSLMARVAFGALRGPGVVALDGGLFKSDFGLRLTEAERAEVQGLLVFNLEAGLGYDRVISRRARLHAGARLQQRVSNLDGLDQLVGMGAAWMDLDLARYLGVSVGMGYAQLLQGEVKDFTVNFADVGRSGFTTLLDRFHDRSLNLALATTYARTESFDVDIFSSFRVAPEPGAILGAGLRWRL